MTLKSLSGFTLAISQRLAARRKALPTRLSQEAFARRAKLHRTEFSSLERGKREPRLLSG
jgi:transcriptional regulator with XRE-family HTH domain